MKDAFCRPLSLWIKIRRAQGLRLLHLALQSSIKEIAHAAGGPALSSSVGEGWSIRVS
jgi:hypothetical protein